MAPKAQLIIGAASTLAAGRLSLDIHLASEASFTAQSQPQQPDSAEKAVVPVPDVHKLHSDIASRKVVACESKRLRTVKQLQSHINYLQRTHGLVTGRLGGWNGLAQAALEEWLLQNIKGRSSSPALAIEDEKQEHPQASAAIPLEDEKHEHPKASAADSLQDNMGQASTEAEGQAAQADFEADATADDEKTGSDESAASDSSSSSSSTKGAKRRRLLNMALTNLESLQRNLQEVHSDCHDCSRLIVQTINAIKEAI